MMEGLDLVIDLGVEFLHLLDHRLVVLVLTCLECLHVLTELFQLGLQCGDSRIDAFIHGAIIRAAGWVCQLG